MQTMIVTKLNRLAQTLAIAALAIGAATMALPTAAEAASGSREISKRLNRIAYQVEHIPEIRGPRRQTQAIDNLKKRLYRLNRISDDQRGRRARKNDARIDRLQHRLHRMERQAAYRIDRRDDRRDDRRTGHPTERDDDLIELRQSARWKRQLDGK
jgi:hypothetical protein